MYALKSVQMYGFFSDKICFFILLRKHEIYSKTLINKY